MDAYRVAVRVYQRADDRWTWECEGTDGESTHRDHGARFATSAEAFDAAAAHVRQVHETETGF